MNRKLLLWLLLSVFLVSSFRGGLPVSVANAQKGTGLEPIKNQSMYFTENKGQWDPKILFVGDTSFGKVAFTKDSIYYQIIKTGNKTKSFSTQTIKLFFVNSLSPKVDGAVLLSHYNNYFLGADQTKWASHCRNFVRVTYENVWKGIDLAYFFTPEGMKYEYYVKPTANIRDLQVKVLGADLTNQATTLQIVTKLGTIQDANLLVFDQKTKRSIQSSFNVNQNTFSFQGIPEKRKNTIVIDPLVYSTYLGGSDTDIANANAVDALGNNYITGYTLSTDFPVPSGLYTVSTNSQDAFVSKFDPAGSLLWSTFLGGWSIDAGNSIALDPLGTSVYITGNTSSGTPFPFPTTIGAYQTMIGTASTDCFLTKINSAGDTLLYSTFLGGGNYDTAKDVAVDASGCAYITGYTGSGFPTTFGAYQTIFSGGTYDCFISKINPAGLGIADLIYSTYVGGSGDDRAYGITVGKLTGVATITGLTYSTTPLTAPPPFPFPTTAGALKTLYNDVSSCDAFVTQINTAGSSLLYSTFLGGSGNDVGNGITQDLLGNIYVCGETDSNPLISIGFPTTAGAFQPLLSGTTDCFVTKINPDTTVFPASNQLIYSTYLGGSNYDYAYAIAVDLTGYAYVTGETQSSVQTGTSFPLTPTAEQLIYGGSTDAFVTKLDPAGSTLAYSTYLGGNNTDISNCIAVDLTGNVYITGQTLSFDFPTFLPYQPIHNSVPAYDAFATKIGIINMVLTGAQLLTYVNLGWIVNNPSAGIVGYKIYRADTSNVTFSYLDTVSTLSLAVTYPDTTATLVGETYSYYVVAVDNLNSPIVTSNTVMVTIIPTIAVVSISLTGSLNFNLVNLSWSINPSNTVVNSYQIFRSIATMNAYSLLSSVSGSTLSYTDASGTVGTKYDYFVVAMDNSSPISLPIATSNTVTVGPIHAKPLPILDFSIILNKTEFEKGESVLLQVYVHNLSVSQATNVIVTMTLPGAIEFTSSSGFPGTVSGATVTFPIGNINGLSFKILNLICHVGGKVNADTTSSIGFAATCQENVSASGEVNFILKAKKTSSSSVGISILVQNTEQDPVTGKRFIKLGDALVVTVEISGGSFPYTLTVDWGDGTVETFVINSNDDLVRVLKHIYTSRGTFHIKIKIEDASGQSKNSDFEMEIR